MTTPIQRILKRALVRLACQRFIASLVLTVTVAGGTLLVLRVLERGGVLSLDWQAASLWAGTVAVAASLIWVLARLPKREGVARIVDDAAGLKESLSTALSVEEDADDWSRATVADAIRKARGVSLGSALPFRVPQRWPVPVTAVALFLLAGLLPSFTLLGEAQASENETVRSVAVQEAEAEVKEITSRVSEALEKFGENDLASELEAEAEMAKPDSPEGVRRQALAKLTNAKDRLAELRKQKQGESMDTLREKLRELKQGETGPLDEFTKALQKGDFEGAKDALDALKDKLADGSLTEMQKQQLASQLKSLKDQLADAAEDRKQLEEALLKAGLNPDLASADPSALEETLKSNKSLSESQKQALREMKQSSDSACSKCDSMASAAASMSESGESLSPGEMDAMDAQLSELSKDAGSLADMDKAMAEFDKHMESLCQNMGQCEGDQYDPFARPQANQRGRGAGDPYQQKADFASKDEKSTTRAQGGPIIGSTFIEGGKIRGEARQQFSDAVQASGSRAAEAIEENLVPAEYHDAIKHYFGRLDSAAKPTETTPKSE